MPTQGQYDQAAHSLKSLACLAFAIAVSKASPIPQSIDARGTGMNSPSPDPLSLKNVVDWLFVCVAITVVVLLFISRVLFLRAGHRPLRDFFTVIEAPHQRAGPPQALTRPTPNNATTTPPVRQGREPTRGTDVDSEGRRGGGPDPDDANGDLTEKDVLPAYEVKGGPPNYIQSPQPQSLGAREGTSNPSVQASPILDIQLPSPPPPSYNPGTVTSHPDVYHAPANR